MENMLFMLSFLLSVRINMLWNHPKWSSRYVVTSNGILGFIQAGPWKSVSRKFLFDVFGFDPSAFFNVFLEMRNDEWRNKFSINHHWFRYATFFFLKKKKRCCKFKKFIRIHKKKLNILK